MRVFWGRVLSIIVGGSSGVIITTGVLAFITIIGIIPRLTEKTDTKKHFLAVGTAAFIGINVGSFLSIWEVEILLPKPIIALYGLAEGIFIGCLAVALTEVLNVLPIVKRRLSLRNDLGIVLLVFSVGKMVGSLVFWFYPGIFG